MAKKTVFSNEYHELADAAGLERQNIYGWQVTRGQTKVRMNDGTLGTITEWFGGHMILDSMKHVHRDDIAEIITY